VDWLGSLHTDHGWMEFIVPKGQPLERGFTVHVSHRSDHQWEEGLLRELCHVFGWSILDLQGVGTYRMFHASGGQQLRGVPDGKSDVE
jgi:hypothetical protein